MLLIPCPNCGERNVTEFRYGEELNAAPAAADLTPAIWSEYLYMRRNVLGVQREWWYHRPCGCWLVAERHTKSQEIVRTYLTEK